jgi:hypothetical protein
MFRNNYDVLGNQNSLVKYAVEAQRNEVTLCTPFLKG